MRFAHKDLISLKCFGLDGLYNFFMQLFATHTVVML